ncbi:hypothetical protein XENTR_v10017618 [Xenopus tropicalis]|nr:hypothetical protein XENTR_v10017618 [Xenopus tropicalis]
MSFLGHAIYCGFQHGPISSAVEQYVPFTVTKLASLTSECTPATCPGFPRSGQNLAGAYYILGWFVLDLDRSELCMCELEMFLNVS